jgi:outer membrane immunogenic protein
MKPRIICAWFVSTVVALTLSGPVSRSASAAGQQQPKQKGKTSGYEQSKKVEVKEAVLMSRTESTPPASSSAPAAAASPAPAPFSGFTWTGFYFGGHAGYVKGNADTDVRPLPDAATFINLAPTTLKPNPKGGFGGAQVGFNWQAGHLVIGAEFDFSGARIDGTTTVTPITQNNGTPFPGAGFLTSHQHTSWFGTLRPRVGIALVPRLLIYGTGGLAFAHVDYSADVDFRPAGTEHYPASLTMRKKGWVAGAGAELALTRKWSVKGEYLHYDLGSQSVTANPAIPLPPFQIAYTWQTTANLANFGVNFRF